MASSNAPDIVISGVGVVSAVGQGQAAFTEALLEGRHNFGVMRRPGRQCGDGNDPTTAFLGAEVRDLAIPKSIPSGKTRTASLSAQMALTSLSEAWADAKLSEVDPARIGLIIGGSNFQQRELVNTHTSYAKRQEFLHPVYGLSFMDTDLCGMCTEAFQVRAFAHTLGGASASGQLAVIHAIQAVQRGDADVCIAVGALMDLSYWECQGLRSLGAMGSDRHASQPELACRPFDRSRDGFIYGEGCGALVVERLDATHATINRNISPYARLSGWAVQIDGNRNPNPSLDGEIAVIQQCLNRAGLDAEDIDYVNPHGSGSLIGDETELKAIKKCGLSHARLNTTKSITGHGLSAAGALELIATVLQMKAGRLHPTRNLDEPIEPSLQWVGETAETHRIDRALKLSMGFGGINTAVCLQRV